MRGPESPFEQRLRHLLRGVAAGSVDPDEATASLRDLPFTELGFARVDHHRELRQGQCEIVYAEGKTPGHVTEIVESLLRVNLGPVLVTRASAAHVAAVQRVAQRAGFETEHDELARLVVIPRNLPVAAGRVAVVTAGTADLPVAKEAAVTARILGAAVDLQADVGVAGLHRLASIVDRLHEADAVVVVAGMEGALASVVGGIVSCPVIACPTNVGYGASFGGLAALLAMLSSCAPGVVSVNIDDGVGAGFAAALIARQSAFGAERA